MKVLDASAVLALLNAEPGAETVAEQLATGDAVVSAVNFAEIMGKVFERGVPEPDAAALWRRLAIGIEPVSAAVALRAALLQPQTRPLGLSLGDRCCLALAQELGGAVVVTADRAWRAVPGFEFVFVR